MKSASLAASLSMLIVLSACGGAEDSPAHGDRATRGAPGSPARLVRRAPPARTPEPEPPPDPGLEACIVQGLQGPGYDGLDPRDARRRLRRLQVKADCEARRAR
jgi:hypothetical protein